MEISAVVGRSRDIQNQIRELWLFIKENEDDEAFRYWCEGLPDVAKAALAIISGDK